MPWLAEVTASPAAGVLRPAAVTTFKPLFQRTGRSLPLPGADQQFSGNGVEADFILFTILLPA